MQTMRQRSTLRLATREQGVRVPANSRPCGKHADPIGVLGTVRALAAWLRQVALETVGQAIREKPRM